MEVGNDFEADKNEDFKAASMKDSEPIRQSKLEKIPVAKILRIPEPKRVVPDKAAMQAYRNQGTEQKKPAIRVKKS